MKEDLGRERRLQAERSSLKSLAGREQHVLLVVNNLTDNSVASQTGSADLILVIEGLEYRTAEF